MKLLYGFKARNVNALLQWLKEEALPFAKTRQF